MKLLTMDVGNTNTVLGLFDGDSLVAQWRASTDARRTADEWTVLLQQFLSWQQQMLTDLDGVAIGSVVQRTTLALVTAFENARIPATVVTSRSKTGMPVLLDDPTELGADRIANAIAAYDQYGGPVVVVDLGTATAFDIVSANGEFLGGIILPGIEISLDALFDRAAALKRVQLTPPANVIGKNTTDAVRSGAMFGFTAQVDGLCERIEKELGPCTIVATGGLATVIAPLSGRIHHHDPALTLRGLRLIWLRS